MVKKIRRLADLPAKLDIESLQLYKQSGIDTYVMTEDFAKLNSDGYIQGLKNCEEVGLKVFIRGYNRGDYFDNCTIDFNEFPCVEGFYLWDEPGASKFDEIAQTMIPFMERYPDKFWHINLFPSYASPVGCLETESDENGTAYENYVNGYVNKVLKKVKNKKDISLDFYPLRFRVMGENYGTNYICDEWLSDLLTIALANKNLGQECIFNCCIQVYEGGIGIRPIRSTADVRFQCYVSMAMGAQSFEFYQYGPHFTSTGMLGLDFKPKIGYYAVKEVLAELDLFQEKYLQYIWQGVSTICPENSKVKAFELLEGRTLDLPIGVESVKSNGCALMGSFKNDQGENAYVLADYGEPTEDRNQTIKIVFEKEGVYTVYKRGKKVEELLTKELCINLDSGDGVFITYKEK